ncbi:MAG TPA: helix-hairpin-helix domain-containing protein [Blastocatellia bacterium]|nr:helix-hairpin-helix domain-containing protein [Blastocatellia bacterium]
MTNEEVAAVFRRLADLMELCDDNPFKLRAYRNAAEVIEDFSTPLAEIVEVGGAAALRDLPGIGAAISSKIIEVLETGTCRAYEEIKREIPESVLDLLRVEGIGMKTAQILFRQFKITTLDDLAKFVRGGGLRSVPRLGDKAQSRIAASVFKLVS